jgi:hypothetical protein
MIRPSAEMNEPVPPLPAGPTEHMASDKAVPFEPAAVPSI